MPQKTSKKSTVTERDDDVRVEPPEKPYTRIDVLGFLLEDKEIASSVLLILNQPLNNINLARIWKRTGLHICADGGANRLYDRFTEEDERKKYVPDFLVGDFDSLRDDVRRYYESLGTKSILQETQYCTDYGKAMALAQLYFKGGIFREKLLSGDIEKHNGLVELLKSDGKQQHEHPIDLYILGGIGGRFDQTIHSINQLYVCSKEDPHIRQFFVTPEDIVFLVLKGKNYIHYQSKTLLSASKVPICSMLPLGNEEVTLSTDGLKYDVKNWKSSMRGSVSTSNGLSGIEGIVVDTSADIIVTLEINGLF